MTIFTNPLGALFMSQLGFFFIAFMEIFLLASALLAFLFGIRMMYNLFV